MTHHEASAVIPDLTKRPLQNTICLFDVDGTLTPARKDVSPEMLALLSQLRHKCAIGFVGGSDLAKQEEQLGRKVVKVETMFDYCFSENGLTAFRMGEPLASTSFIEWLGEEKYKRLVKFVLRYIADLDIPFQRGTFVEFRNGMVNISPVGRNCTGPERDAYEKFDLEHKVREKFVATLRKEFADLGLTYSIGGQISFDAFPTGWDKTYCLRHIENEEKVSGIKFDKIHFFGDKCYPGGNDYEIFEDKRTIGHSVKNPEETMKILKELFEL